MNNHSAEDYLDKLLNSVNGEEIEDIPDVSDIPDVPDVPDVDGTSPFDVEDIFETKKEKKNGREMVSRRVSKSEADFLMEFEAELEGDNFDDFIKHFDDEEVVAEDRLGDKDIFAQEPVLAFDDIPVMEQSAVAEEPVVEETTEMDFASVFGATSLEDASMMNEEAPLDAMSVFDTMPELEEAEMPAAPVMEDSQEDDGFSLGGIDLGALLSEATADDPVETLPVMETPVEGTSEEVDPFADFFGGEATGEVTTSDDDVFANLFGADGAGESIDLSNMGEADLMSLLSGDGDLSDIGDMLSQNDTGAIPIDGTDAFSAFAESEMSGMSDEGVSESVPAKKEGKGGFLGKISAILSGLMGGDDEDEDASVALKKGGAPKASELSGENDEILASLDALEGTPSEKKEKKKKEKKPKKEKAPKEKKPKKEKAPKPKKEKKPKEVDNTPPLPRGPVMMIWLMVGSLCVLVMLGVNLSGYAVSISNAKSLLNNAEYAAAFAELDGVEIKEKDMMLYNQVATLAPVDSELNAYYAFASYERHEEALDSLICAAGRVEINEDGAEVYECLGQMEILKKEVSNELEQKYDMTYEEALEIYHLKDRDEYTIALYEKLEELGLIKE